MVQPADDFAVTDMEMDGADGQVFTFGLQSIKKAADKGGAVPEGQAKNAEEAAWTGLPIIPTPLPVLGLVHWYERSAILRPNVAAMVSNVTGFGWKLTPTLDLEAEEAAEEVETAMWLHRLAQWEAAVEALPPGEDEPEPPEPPEADEVEETLKEWKRKARQEFAQLQVKLDAMCFEYDFAELNARQETGQNVVGWGTWEVIRAKRSRKIVRLKHVEPWTLRLTPVGAPVTVEESVPVSKVHYTTIPVSRRFRQVIQHDMDVVWLKEFGDPRVMSPKSGRFYKTEAELLRKEPDVTAQANEVLWFADYAIGTPYGRPPWSGISPGVRGSRLASDNTVDDLLNSSVPRGLLLMNDARFGKSAVPELKAFFNANHGKVRNRLAVVEASTSTTISQGGATGTIEYIPLTSSQHSDATFLAYQEATALDASAQFGIPPVLTGRTKEYNKATSEAAKEAAEESTFRPKRGRFDGAINRKLFRDMGVRFWKFESKGSTRSDPDKIASLLLGAVKEGALTPAEARPVLEKLLGIDLMSEAGPWQRQPKEFTLAGIQPPEDTTADEATGDESDADDDGEAEPPDTEDGAQGADEGQTERSLAKFVALMQKKADHIADRLPADTRSRGEQILRELERGD